MNMDKSPKIERFWDFWLSVAHKCDILVDKHIMERECIS